MVVVGYVTTCVQSACNLQQHAPFGTNSICVFLVLVTTAFLPFPPCKQGDAFITTGRLHWEDYYQYQEEAAAVGSLEVTPEIVEEIKEERVEAKMEQEAEANQAKLDQGRRGGVGGGEAWR